MSNPREEEVYRATVGYILDSVAPKLWRLRTISVLYREVTRRRPRTRATRYFAEPFEAPEWRAKWVERMES